jgi:hypothetical protein
VRFRGIHAGIANFTRGSGTHSCGCPDGRHGKGPLPTTHCDWPGHYCDWIGTAVPHPLHLFAKGHIKAPWCTLPRASSCTPESAACCAPNDAVWQVSVRAPPVSASGGPPPPPPAGGGSSDPRSQPHHGYFLYYSTLVSPFYCVYYS